MQLLESPLQAVARPVSHASGSCSLDTIQQEMERLPHGTRRLAVRLRMDLDPSWLWAVLTDYPNLSQFIPNLKSSRLLWRRANVVGLEQEGCQMFMGLRFKARVQLELTELPTAAGALKHRPTTRARCWSWGLGRRSASRGFRTQRGSCSSRCCSRR